MFLALKIYSLIHVPASEKQVDLSRLSLATSSRSNITFSLRSREITKQMIKRKGRLVAVLAWEKTVQKRGRSQV